MYVDLPLPTRLGTLRILPVRATTAYVTVGQDSAVSVDGADVVVSVRVTRARHGNWRIADHDFSAEQITNSVSAAPVTERQRMRLQAAIIDAVNDWTRDHEPLLLCVEFVATLDRSSAIAEQRLRQLTRQALTVQQATTALVKALADMQADLAVKRESLWRFRSDQERTR